MTNSNFVDELKSKQNQGLLKPSDFKRNRSNSLPNNNQKEQEITQLQGELSTFKEQLKRLLAEKEALELALFDKRLENLNQFTHYRDKINHLKETELSELANCKKQIEFYKKKLENNHNHTISLNKLDKIIITILTLILFINLLK